MRRRKLNPDDARRIERDIDDTVQGAAPAIDVVYEEYKISDRQLAHLNDILESIQDQQEVYQKQGLSVPGHIREARGKTKRLIREERSALGNLSRRIALYAKVNFKRIQERMDLIEASPGANTSSNKAQIREVNRAIFRLKNKAKKPFADLRRDFSEIWGMVVTLESDLGLRLQQRQAKGASPAERREGRDSELASELFGRWKKIRKHAAASGYVGVAEDVEHVDEQFRVLNDRFRRGESIRRRLERLVESIRDIHNRTKPRAELATYADAKKGVGSFVGAIKDYSKKGVTAAGTDRMKYELEQFARQFTSAAKAEWSKVEQREFATDIRRLRKALDRLRPKGRQKNPCVGLHFHGKDTGDLLKALEDSAMRIEDSPKLRKMAKENPGKKKSRPKKVSTLAALKKLPVGTLVTVRDRTGYVVMHTGSKGLHAAPTDWFEHDGLGSGARYFFDEDLEEYFRSGKELEFGQERNPGKKTKKSGGVKVAERRVISALLVEGSQTKAQLIKAYTKKSVFEEVGDPPNTKSEIERSLTALIKRKKIEKVGRKYQLTESGSDERGLSKLIGKSRSKKPATDASVEELVDEWSEERQSRASKRNPKKKVAKKKASKKKARKNPRALSLKRNDLVEIRAEQKGVERIFVGRVTDVAAAGYGIREGDFFKEPDWNRRALTLIKDQGWFQLHVGTSVRHWNVDGVKVVGRVTSGPKGEPTPHAVVLDPNYRGRIKHAKTNPGKKKVKKKVAKKTTRKTSPSQRLIKRCQKLWDAYCEKPTKKNLRAVLEHLEKMTESTAKSVKDERGRCLRAANKEAKRLKLKR